MHSRKDIERVPHAVVERGEVPGVVATAADRDALREALAGQTAGKGD